MGVSRRKPSHRQRISSRMMTREPTWGKSAAETLAADNSTQLRDAALVYVPAVP